MPSLRRAIRRVKISNRTYWARRFPRESRPHCGLVLQGKHAIVTGGGRGIGKPIAREMAREGVDVAIVARNKADLEPTERELVAGTNQRILHLAADVTSKDKVDRMVAEAA
jgi:NAD(P)-dependent dehydrogenase (short-subunit alcohol dehydrogenase family)